MIDEVLYIDAGDDFEIAVGAASSTSGKLYLTVPGDDDWQDKVALLWTNGDMVVAGTASKEISGASAKYGAIEADTSKTGYALVVPLNLEGYDGVVTTVINGVNTTVADTNKFVAIGTVLKLSADAVVTEYNLELGTSIAAKGSFTVGADVLSAKTEDAGGYGVRIGNPVKIKVDTKKVAVSSKTTVGEYLTIMVENETLNDSSYVEVVYGSEAPAYVTSESYGSTYDAVFYFLEGNTINTGFYAVTVANGAPASGLTVDSGLNDYIQSADGMLCIPFGGDVVDKTAYEVTLEVEGGKVSSFYLGTSKLGGVNTATDGDTDTCVVSFTSNAAGGNWNFYVTPGAADVEIELIGLKRDADVISPEDTSSSETPA